MPKPPAAPTSAASLVGAAPMSLAECPISAAIKGNVGRGGEKIYHLPGGNSYRATYPERCFASVVEAERAGYRAAMR